ncbi:MAG: sulfotransferase [Nitrosopumilus sp.]|nr:sulfotransferase [Nitrosopumilus sp.]
MQNNTKEKIKINNLNDILKENLRILESDNELNTLDNTDDLFDQESKIQKSSYNRESFSNDEHDLTILDLPDISKGKKSLRKIRFLLHREIRDWVVFPLQRKQSEINSKIIHNFNEIYSELDILNQRIDTKFEEFIQINYSIKSAIRKTYGEILGRNPDDESLQYYFYKIALGEFDFDQLKNELKQSKEYQKIKEEQDIVNKITSSIKKPIFIIGVPRSGTTLVHSILCNHEDLAWASDEDLGEWLLPIEQFRIDSLYKWLKANNKKIPMSEEALFVFGKDLGDGLKQFGTTPKGSSKIPIEGEILWREIFGTDYIEDITNDRKIKLSQEISNITKRQKKTRFVCKAPNNSFRLFAIQKIFPDAKFINVSRDPKAVVSSMLERYEKEGEFDIGMYEKTKNDVKFQSLDSIEKFSWFYKEFTDAIIKFSAQNKNNFMTIAYEDLLKNPTEVIQSILEFCDLNLHESVDEMVSLIQQNPSDKWKKNLSQKDIEKISNFVSTQ